MSTSRSVEKQERQGWKMVGPDIFVPHHSAAGRQLVAGAIGPDRHNLCLSPDQDPEVTCDRRGDLDRPHRRPCTAGRYLRNSFAVLGLGTRSEDKIQCGLDWFRTVFVEIGDVEQFPDEASGTDIHEIPG